MLAYGGRTGTSGETLQLAEATEGGKSDDRRGEKLDTPVANTLAI